MKNASTPPTQENNYFVAHNDHLLQSWAWGELKSHFGWTPQRVHAAGATAQILFRHFPNRKFFLFGRSLPMGLTMAYIPKGPTIDWHNAEQCQALFSTVHAEARKHRAIFLKIEPNVWNLNSNLDSKSASKHSQQAQALTQFLNQARFTPADTIQPQTSIVIDLSGDEDAILAAMKQKTRYNIRLAQRKGVIIRQGSQADIPIFYNLAELTSARDGFGIHSLNYYQTAYKLFAPNHCALFIAEFQSEPLAALMVFSHGSTAYYFYGASSNTHRNLMPTYLIQWAAICWAKSQGCTHYDLWGIPNANVATLEAEFTHRRAGLWGVYRFKRGFGGQVIKNVGAFDYVYKPLLYKIYIWYQSRQIAISL
jgi:lipid II:glycine glycyltransferase (peptidoglycan interpeptide bridge formation enzyme)